MRVTLHKLMFLLGRQVLFVNDVYFCAEDAWLLLLHDAHMASGMDIYAIAWDAKKNPDCCARQAYFLPHQTLICCGKIPIGTQIHRM